MAKNLWFPTHVLKTDNPYISVLECINIKGMLKRYAQQFPYAIGSIVLWERIQETGISGLLPTFPSVPAAVVILLCSSMPTSKLSAGIT